MAIYRIWSGGSDTAPYDTWAKAATLAQTAFTAGAAGDDFWIASDHQETSAATTTYTLPGTPAVPCRVISIDRTDDSYLKASAYQLQTTGTADIYLAGTGWFTGIYMDAADDYMLPNSTDHVFDDSLLVMSGGGSAVIAGASSGQQHIRFKNTDLNVAASGGAFTISNDFNFEWHGGAYLLTGTGITYLFDAASKHAVIEVTGVDLSAHLGTLNDMSHATAIHTVRYVNCKLSSAVTPYNSVGRPGSIIELIGCDDTTGNELFRYLRATMYGEITQDNAVYVTAEEGDGTNVNSLKMVSNANALEYSKPISSARIAVWVDATGSKTFTLPFVWDSATALNDDDIWMELEYLGAAGNTQLTLANDRMADIQATPAAQTTSTEGWTGTGGFSNVQKQEIAVTATIGRVGLAYVTVHLAKPSTTVYVGRKVQIT